MTKTLRTKQLQFVIIAMPKERRDIMEELEKIIFDLLKNGYKEQEIINTVRSQSAKLELPKIENLYKEI